MAERTETHCIYVAKRGLNKGRRCHNPIKFGGYCDNHKGREGFAPHTCRAHVFNSFDDWRRPGQGTWYPCPAVAGKSGYCDSCVDSLDAKSELATRCQHVLPDGNRCHRKADQDGYCLHCIYNNLPTVGVERVGDQPLITNFFKPQETQASAPAAEASESDAELEEQSFSEQLQSLRKEGICSRAFTDAETILQGIEREQLRLDRLQINDTGDDLCFEWNRTYINIPIEEDEAKTRCFIHHIPRDKSQSEYHSFRNLEAALCMAAYYVRNCDDD